MLRAGTTTSSTNATLGVRSSTCPAFLTSLASLAASLRIPRSRPSHRLSRSSAEPGRDPFIRGASLDRAPNNEGLNSGGRRPVQAQRLFGLRTCIHCSRRLIRPLFRPPVLPRHPTRIDTLPHAFVGPQQRHHSTTRSPAKTRDTPRKKSSYRSPQSILMRTTQETPHTPRDSPRRDTPPAKI